MLFRSTQLGLPLFHRHPKGMTLTDGGRLLLVEATRILEDVAATEARMQRVAQGRVGLLKVGFTSSAAAHAFTPALLREFRAHHAGIDLAISEMNAAELTAAVGQRHALRVAVEQRQAELRLERADLLAQRRLLDAQLGRGARHVARAGDGGEVAQLPQVHRSAVSGWGDSAI